MLLLSHFWFCSVSLFPSLFLCLSLSLPLSMSLRWFMALFKRRPHVSPDAAICFNAASFFHSSPSEGNREPTKINPWLLCTQQSVFCGSSQVVPASGNLTGLHGDSTAVLTERRAGPALCCCCCKERVGDVEKWHATRMPLIMLTGKVGKMADVTRPFYQPNFIKGFHVWAGKSGYFSSTFIL